MECIIFVIKTWIRDLAGLAGYTGLFFGRLFGRKLGARILVYHRITESREDQDTLDMCIHKGNY